MSRRKTNMIVVIAALPLLAYAGWVGYVRFCLPSVQSNKVIGKTEGQLRASYGKPDRDRQGYRSLGLSVPPSLPQGAIRTLIFEPRGLFHPEGGTLWVWLVERDGEWDCFASCWFADGVKF